MPPLSLFSRNCLALAISQALLIPAQAAIIQVTSNTDNGTGGCGCTLREAIVSMNAGEAESGCSNTGELFGTNDSITFSTSLTSNTITLAGSQLAFSAGLVVSIDASNIDGGITVDAAKKSRVLYVNAATLTIHNMTITGGSVATGNHGGGVLATNSSIVSLSNSTVSRNSAGRFGGGIFASDSSRISLSNSTMSGNSAYFFGGGLFARDSSSISLASSTVSGNSSGRYGGGLFATLSSGISLSNSTVSGNSARHRGGGLYASGSPINLSNSTVSGNSARFFGGGLFVRDPSSVSLSNSTVSGNSANRGGGLAATFSSKVSLSNSIIANSENGGDCYYDNSTVYTDTASIIEDGSCGATRSGDPGLLPLADNGGTTKTHALRRNSIARDTGVGCTSYDQTGWARDTQCDVGAVEFNPNNEDGSFVIPLSNGRSAVIVL